MNQFGDQKDRERKETGIFVTPEELEQVKTAYKCSGMWMAGGIPLGDPYKEIALLSEKYGFPGEGTGFNMKTGEFVIFKESNNNT